MYGPNVFCFLLLWTGIHALKNFYVQNQADHLLCSEIVHETGICRSVMFDIKYLSCVKKKTPEYVRKHESIVNLKKVSMCVSVHGVFTSSVNVCRLTKLNGTFSKTGFRERNRDIPTRQQAVTTDRESQQTRNAGLTASDQVISTRQQSVLSDRKPQRQRHEDINPSTVQPELITESTVKDMELTQYNHNISLHQACRENKLDVVKYILSQGLEHINRLAKWKRTPVMVAARHGHFRVFEYLVSQGCNLSAVDYHKNNVLHLACCGVCVDIVRYLITTTKVDIESRGRYGKTPIMFAASFGIREVLALLWRSACNLTVQDDQNNNLLHIACFHSSTDNVQFILAQGIFSIDSRGHYGKTPVMIAVITDHKKLFDILMKKGCNLTAVDVSKNNILHLSCFYGLLDMANHILSLNIISLESRGFCGRTPVMQAIWQGNKAMFDLLHPKDCNLATVDDNGNNILHMASHKGHVNMVKYLITLKVVEGMGKVKNKYNYTPLQEADRKGHITVVRLLKDWK